MRLTLEERHIADGGYGEAAALAMSILTTLGERYDARDMVPITGAHVDGCIYRGDDEVSLLFAEKLAAAGARVRVPTTLSAGARDLARWRELRLPEAFAAGCRRMEQAYLARAPPRRGPAPPTCTRHSSASGSTWRGRNPTPSCTPTR